ncbi:MAG: DUF4148 domain-containing protein [Pseudomonadota bacterium]
MNAKYIVSIALIAAAGTALAETPTPEPARTVSSVSRAQVQAELAAYKKAGVNPWSTTYNPLRGFKSTLTREQVTADYLASRDVVAATTGEDSGSAYYTLLAARNVRGTTLAGQPASAQ